MKNTNRIGLLTLLALMIVSLTASAQNESDVSAFLQATKQDANTLITGYTAPIIKGVSYGLTNGWYNTAKTHKTLGFDLGFSMSAVFTPKADDYFTPQLSNGTTLLNTTTGSTTQAPSIVGPKDATTYTSTFEGQSVSFSGPEGLAIKKAVGVSAIPVPMIQLGIGIIKNTDLKIRFVPQQSKGNTKGSMFGIGVMHDIKQYFPGDDLLPFDLSVLAAFTNVKGTTSLVNTDDNNKPLSNDGAFKYTLNSWVAQDIISKKISVLTGYLGVGYGSVSTTADITGTFQVEQNGQNIGSISDPFSTKFKNKSAKLTAGLRLKFGPIYLVGDYTVQKYNAFTAGIGVAIR